MPELPAFSTRQTEDGLHLILTGSWTSETGHSAERLTDDLLAEADGIDRAWLDLAQVERLDTAGAWLIDRTRQAFEQKGIAAEFAGARPEFVTLLTEAHYRPLQASGRPTGNWLVGHLADIGEGVSASGLDLWNGISFLGEVVVKTLRLIVDPRR